MKSLIALTLTVSVLIVATDTIRISADKRQTSDNVLSGSTGLIANFTNRLSGGPLPGDVGLVPQLVYTLTSGLSGTAPPMTQPIGTLNDFVKFVTELGNLAHISLQTLNNTSVVK
ncbi:hypothetical protein CHUAL_011896 [Chamberlinius hualienensis]